MSRYLIWIGDSDMEYQRYTGRPLIGAAILPQPYLIPHSEDGEVLMVVI